MAADLATLTTRLSEIEAILAEGVSSVSIGGRAITYDLAALRAERKTIERQIAQIDGTRPSVRRGVYNPHYYGS